MDGDRKGISIALMQKDPKYMTQFPRSFDLDQFT
jgi:hypothetical protein